MLQLKGISKSYTTGDFKQVALNNVDLSFRRNEFVAILGTSGSGKTTLLNVIGGLDQYDSGDLIINGKSTKNFKDGDWDAYRNNSVGFIFQSYNLITHLSVIDNVELGMTLSGVSSAEKHNKAMEALERVGLKDHAHKKPNQLSGGEMQRVAIARALANDPDIILADEPTGALDTTTSKQIMDLIKEIADDKLVIMVTHNPEIAGNYADRIVQFKDGCVIDDSNPYQATAEDTGYQLKKTSMSFLTALNLSGKNISTKKGRTFLTALASSIGIIGIAVILSLSSGFQKQIDQFQTDALSEFPIIISQTSVQMDKDSLEKMRGVMLSGGSDKEYADTNEVILYHPADEKIAHTNVFTDDYMTYLSEIDPAICSSIGYTRIVGMNILRDIDGSVAPVSFAVGFSGIDSSGAGGSANTLASSSISSMRNMGMTAYPEALDNFSKPYLQTSYDLLAGEYPTQATDLVLVVDSQNRIDTSILEKLGFQTKDVAGIAFDQIIGTEMKLITNDDYYIKTAFGNYMPGSDYQTMYASANNITLSISGIVRLKAGESLGLVGNGIAYSDALITTIAATANQSEIVKAQREADYNVMTMGALDENAKENILTYLGGDTSPLMVYLYPTDFASKEAVLTYLDDYNTGKAVKDTVVYTDLASTITNMTGGIMDAITLVLIAFAAISLVVSLIMIGIITYISVLERTKEIGILRALGARKKDITRVFNAETFIIGICSGTLGISIAYLLTIPINNLLQKMTGLARVAQLNPLHALLLVTISLVLTLIGGAIPAKMAAKKDPVEALRTE